ncbi:hypothetical protein, partial [Streptomyces sp. NPDC057199]|uniref:hypothetical protein n=1 Tax=Streptomyces sp. NPDC057199 TaxID=3346047 RepID=UPI003631FCBF
PNRPGGSRTRHPAHTRRPQRLPHRIDERGVAREAGVATGTAYTHYAPRGTSQAGKRSARA